MDNQINIEEIEIEIKLNPKGEMLAQVEVSYKALRLKGYRVMKSTFSEDGLYITPPAVKAGKGWVKLIRFDDPSLWAKIESKIKTSYQNLEMSQENLTSEVQNGVNNGENLENEFFTNPDDDFISHLSE